MNIVVYVNKTFEEERALYDLDNKKVLIKGDYYHDKVDYLIKGFLIAKGIREDSVQTIYIDSDNSMFSKLDFYDENEC